MAAKEILGNIRRYHIRAFEAVSRWNILQEFKLRQYKSIRLLEKEMIEDKDHACQLFIGVRTSITFKE